MLSKIGVENDLRRNQGSDWIQVIKGSNLNEEAVEGTYDMLSYR